MRNVEEANIVTYPLEGVDMHLSTFTSMLQKPAIRILVGERQACIAFELAGATFPKCKEFGWVVHT